MINKKVLFAIISSFILNSCYLGTYNLEPNYSSKQEYVFDNNNKSQIKSLNDEISIELEWLGNAPSVVTSKNVIGAIQRYVIPYTRKTSLINIKVENKSKENINIDPQNIEIETVQSKQLKPYTIDYFKKLWPTKNINSQEILLDQSRAIGEVIKTIFRKKTLSTNQSYEGILAFEKLDENQIPAKIIIKVNENSNEISITFDLIKK